MDAADRLPEAADVTIVGGGIIGTSTAYFLSTETDLDVLLVERDAIASGSTGDSSAIIRHHYGGDAIYSELAAWSHEFYRNFEAETGEAIAYEPNRLVRMGEAGAESGDYADAGYEVLEDLDIPVSRYEGQELETEFPMLNLDGIDFAVEDETAAYSDATDVAGGFARAAQNEGATVVTGVTVDGFAVEDDAVTAVETDAGRVETDDVLLAAGPWTPDLAEKVDVDVPIRREREQIILLEPSDEFVAEEYDMLPTTSRPGVFWYMRPDFNDGVLIATHYRGEEVDPDAYKRDPDQEILLELVDEIEDFVPGLTDAKLRGEYCGVYSNTPDRDFILDQIGPQGFHVACGFSGHGFKHGPSMGKVLSDMVAEGDTDLTDLSYFSMDRFEDNPEGHEGGTR
ncbi:FAD-binding oxidoreductase [Haloarculaceae archaeon H-GB2-1]|nr:FAD-binding oxidoreductase [Haloarculaceae archaeon H-GB1-1]MEA5407935.1 FAD-binding oxidoreductase [Haloarculaceae archaeon H-GB2-1]